jgi:hypothetical protein
VSVVVRRQLKRRYVLAFFQKLPPCLIGIEACASSHHWSRELQARKEGATQRDGLSGTKDDLGAWFVEPVELHRVFPPAEAEPKAVQQVAQPDPELRIRLAVAEERLGELKAQLEDMRHQRDRWQSQAERLAALPSPPPPATPPKRQSWWQWLRSTG